MNRINLDDLRAKIQSFRVSDLQSLVATFGRSRNGKKQELQNRALEILRTQPSDVDMKAFAAKVFELYRIAQEEAKQSAAHYDYQGQRPVIQQPRGPNPYANTNFIQQQPGRPATNTIVYQNGGIVGGNGYPNATVYAVPQNPPTIQPPAAIASNLGNTVRIISPPLSCSNITFRTLPFYKVKHEILKPTVLKIKANGRTNGPQLFQISFVLTCEIASEISMHRDLTKNEYNVQAQLRICGLDNNAPIYPGAEYDDLLPLGLYVRMNDRQCPLPPSSPCTRPNVEARRIPLPINVTQFMKLSPMNVNKLAINWTAEVGRTFVMSLNVVEKLTSSYLLEKLKERPRLSVDITKQTIARQYKRVIDDDDEDNANADDDDIATTIVRVSLQCPLAKFRMMYPAKGKNCGHLQCFDGFAYISCNEKKSVWMCPVCNRTLYYDDLLIDQYFVDVLASDESADCQEVQLFVDGSWKVYDEENANEGNEKTDQRNSLPNSPSEQLSLTSSGDSSSDIADRKNVVSESVSTVTATPAMEPVVDLTMEDEDEDDVPEAQEGRPESVPPAVHAADEQSMLPSGTATGSLSAVSNASPPPSPESVSQPVGSPTSVSPARVSPAPTSPAQVSPAPASPVLAPSPQISSQEELSSAPREVEPNPMVMSPSPSPDSKIAGSQESNYSAQDDIPMSDITEDISPSDTPIIDAEMDDLLLGASSATEPTHDNAPTTSLPTENEPSSDASSLSTPKGTSLPCDKTTSKLNDKRPAEVPADPVVEKYTKDTDMESDSLLDSNEEEAKSLNSNEEAPSLDIDEETPSLDADKETQSLDVDEEASSSDADKEASSLNVDEEASSSNIDKEASGSDVNEEAIKSNVDKRTPNWDANKKTSDLDIPKKVPNSFDAISTNSIISLEDSLSPLGINPSSPAPSAMAALNLDDDDEDL